MGVYFGEEKVAFCLGGQKFRIKDTFKKSSIETLVIGNPIVVTDVIDEIHPLDINLSSDVLTDFSGIKVSRYGRNLLKWNFSIIASSNTCKFNLYLPKGTYNFNSNFHKTDTADKQYGVFINKGDSVNYQQPHTIIRNFAGKSFKDTFTVEESGDYTLYFRSTTGTTVDELEEYLLKVNPAQIAFGDTVLPIAPYVDSQTATADENGVVEGLTSISPNMTIFADNDDVIINLKYYKEMV